MIYHQCVLAGLVRDYKLVRAPPKNTHRVKAHRAGTKLTTNPTRTCHLAICYSDTTAGVVFLAVGGS